MVGRIREILFDEGVDVDGIAIEAASKDYVDGKFDPKLETFEEGIWLDNTSGLPTLSPWRAGVIAWDIDNKCMAVSSAYEGTWVQVGEETQDDGVNKTGGTLANGTVVYIDGAQGNRPKLYKANANDPNKAQKTIGLVTADAGIADNAEGPYTTSGVVRNLDTSAYTDGDMLWLSTTDGQYTTTKPSNQYRSIMIGIVVKAHITQGEIYVNVRDLTDEIALMGYHTIDPHGWTEYDDTYMTRSWVGTTFTLTQVGASTPYYYKGQLKFLTGNKSITLNPTAGPHFIALNCATEELEDLGSTLPISQVMSTHLITEFAYCSGVVVLYNANERHTTKFLKRDWIYKHLSFSTQYRSGITPSITSIDGNGSSIDHARWSVTAGQIADEDIDITTAALISSAIKTLWWYNPAVSVWTKYSEVNGAGVITSGTGRASYNSYSTGLVEATNNYHVLTHLFAANDGTVIGVIGNTEYQLLADARIAASSEIDTLLSTGLPFPEFRAIATFINKTSNTYSNAVKSVIISVDTGVSYIDWRETALNPAAGQNATNHQALSGLQGGQAGEYYHLTAAQFANVFNNVFPTGTSSNTQNKLYLPTNTTSGWNGLTASESLIGWDSTKKKPIVGDGSVFKPIGGGLVPTPIDKDYATALETGKHYIYNGAGMTGDKTLTVQAVAAESNFKVTVYNIPSGYKLILDANASETFRKDDTDYTTVEFVATEVEQSAEFVSNNTQWIVDDGSNALGTVWGGNLSISGTFKADTIEPYTSSGIVLVQSSGSTQLSVKGVGSDPRMRFYSDSTSRGAIAYDATNKFYIMSEGELNLFANGGGGGVQPVRISASGFMDIGRGSASGCAFSANAATNVTIGGLYSTLNSGYTSEVLFVYSAMTSGTGYKFIRCDNATQAAIFYVDGRGYIYAGSTTVSSSSDSRLKDNITILPDGSLSKIMQLKPSTWTWKQEDKIGETKGFIAQDVEAVYPEFVELGGDGYKILGINGAPMIAELVKAIQEQQKQIEELKAEIAAMRGV